MAQQSRFKKATRQKLRLRMAIDGPPGAGKSMTALRFAFALGQRIACIDTESGSLSKYQGDSPDGVPFDFDVTELTTFSPTEYTSAIEEAGRSGFDVLIIDSLSHAWAGKDGALEIKDRQGGNSFTAWKEVTPMHNRMVDAILASPCHIIATMRSKVEHVLEEQVNSKGKTVQVPRKIGMAPVQRAGMEYEFDIYGSMDWSHVLTISKSRCSAVADAVVSKPGPSFIRTVAEWLEKGSDAPAVAMPKRVGEDQIARLKKLFLDLKLTDAAIKSALTARNVTNLTELADGQANEIEATLNERLERQKVAVARTPAGASATNGATHAKPIEENQNHESDLQPETAGAVPVAGH
jgi:hypothetical protein